MGILLYSLPPRCPMLRVSSKREGTSDEQHTQCHLR